MNVATTFEIVRGLHILAVIAWMAGLLFLPRLYAYDAEQADKNALPGKLAAVKDATDAALSDVAAWRHELMLKSLMG